MIARALELLRNHKLAFPRIAQTGGRPEERWYCGVPTTMTTKTTNAEANDPLSSSMSSMSYDEEERQAIQEEGLA